MDYPSCEPWRFSPPALTTWYAPDFAVLFRFPLSLFNVFSVPLPQYHVADYQLKKCWTDGDKFLFPPRFSVHLFHFDMVKTLHVVCISFACRFCLLARSLMLRFSKWIYDLDL